MPVKPETIQEVWDEVDRADAYGPLGLRRNPFPASGNPPASPTIPPFPEVYQQIKAFAVSFLRSRQSRGLVLLGDYGTGKTYHLRWIQNLLEAKTEVRVRVVSVETPGLEPYDLVREILAQVGDQELARAVWTLLLPIIRDRVQTEGQRFFQRFAQGSVRPRRGPQLSLDSAGMEMNLVQVSSEVLRDYRAFLAAFDQSGILSRERLRDEFLPLFLRPRAEGGLGITRNPAIARELANLCFLSGAPALESWERLVVAGRRSPFPPQGEPEFLQTILRLLVETGIEYFVLLLDEFEKVPLMENMTQREMKRYLVTVRMLADRGWQDEALPFAWVIASHDEAWDLVRSELNQALAERFLTEVHLPRSTDPRVARYLVSQHLALVRLAGGAEESLQPFPEDLIELIPPELRHTPRDLLTLCYSLIEEALTSNQALDGRIPRPFVLDFLERLRVPHLDDEQPEETA